MFGGRSRRTHLFGYYSGTSCALWPAVLTLEVLANRQLGSGQRTTTTCHMVCLRRHTRLYSRLLSKASQLKYTRRPPHLKTRGGRRRGPASENRKLKCAMIKAYMPMKNDRAAFTLIVLVLSKYTCFMIVHARTANHCFSSSSSYVTRSSASESTAHAACTCLNRSAASA